jgi:hypothetical protein
MATLALSLAACSSAAPTPSDQSAAGLRAAATAWAHAFLTGTLADIQFMEGTECLSHPNPAVAATYLRGMRAVMERHAGVPLGSIRVVRVETRNITATTGQAEDQYNLPSGRAGNDNWVTYTYENGMWKVSNCHAPIGGESSSTSGFGASG